MKWSDSQWVAGLLSGSLLAVVTDSSKGILLKLWKTSNCKVEKVFFLAGQEGKRYEGENLRARRCEDEEILS